MSKAGIVSYPLWIGLLLTILVLNSVMPGTTPAGINPLSPLVLPTTPALSSTISTNTTVILELTAEPAVVAYERSSQTSVDQKLATQLAVSRLDQTQQQLLPELARRGFKVIFRLQRLYNGIAVQGQTRALAELAKLPGVKAIHTLPVKYRNNAGAMALTGAAAAWSSYGSTGTGIKLGIIDSGIDYLHATFGGPGTVAAYNATDPAVITDTPGYFPNGPKVVDGYDFAGDLYNADNYPTPTPDRDPIEKCGLQASASGSHGTHVAATAAGFGVLETGATYTGTYDSATPTLTMQIAPGVAPGAKLYALKVFGCEGSTQLVSQALEWAIDPNKDGDFADKLDVVNLSLGRPYSSPDDVDGQMANWLARAGVVVVASAGNGGDSYYAGGSPGNAPAVISVAASEDALRVVDGFWITSPPTAQGLRPALKSNDFPWYTSIQLPVIRNLAYPSINKTGCGDFTAQEKSAIAGKIVLLDWVFDCPIHSNSVTRTLKAREAGAKAVIFAFQDPLGDPPDISGSALIPALMVDFATGNLLRETITPPGSVVALKISNEYDKQGRFNNPARNDIVTAFSARESSRGNGSVKPDITAPGLTIFSANSGSGNGGYNESGTSMAAPQVAGAAVLVRQQNPEWTVEEIKANLLNSAKQNIFTTPNHEQILAPARVGAGRLDIPAALANKVLVYSANPNEAGAVSLSFGLAEITRTTFLTKTVKVVNKQNFAVSYTLGYSERTAIPGVNYSFPDGPGVNIAANGTTTVRVQLSLEPELMENSRDTTVPGSMLATDITPAVNLPRAWLSEASGLLTLTPTNGPVLRLPVHVAARAASVMSTTSASLAFETNTGSSVITLTGQGINNGSNYPTSTLGLVSAFEYAGSSPVSPTLPISLSSADLRHVGVASDAAAQGALENSTIYFGIATYNNWNTPADEVTFLIYIDTDRDGEDDYLVVNARHLDTDVFQSLLIPSPDAENTTKVIQNLLPPTMYWQDWLNGLSPAIYNTPLFNTNQMIIPVRAADLKLSSGAATRFNYRIETVSNANFNQQIIDTFPTHSYDYAQPGLSFGSANSPNIAGGTTGVPTFRDLPGLTIPVTYDYQQYKLNGSSGLVLFHQHNAGINERTQVLNIVPPACSQPFTVKQEQDNGNDICGSLSYALREGLAATNQATITINFAIPANAITLTGSLPPINTTKTLTLAANCANNQPGLKIQPALGQAIPYGLIVQNGQLNLSGISLKGFSQRALQAQAGQHTLQCTNLAGGLQIWAGSRLRANYPNQISSQH